ncbi:hypothetical protein E2C01_032496 [Portunus trituberculatus]|uniref:Uncharacterized protein n=1 Tax=Portunus trituberculatus TaxID=210409 RepID=A0A5B7F0F3_PORTR|nr:hypothetical protein [Portunus trituberculatus]
MLFDPLWMSMAIYSPRTRRQETGGCERPQRRPAGLGHEHLAPPQRCPHRVGLWGGLPSSQKLLRQRTLVTSAQSP